MAKPLNSSGSSSGKLSLSLGSVGTVFLVFFFDSPALWRVEGGSALGGPGGALGARTSAWVPTVQGVGPASTSGSREPFL